MSSKTDDKKGAEKYSYKKQAYWIMNAILDEGFVMNLEEFILYSIELL